MRIRPTVSSVAAMITSAAPNQIFQRGDLLAAFVNMKEAAREKTIAPTITHSRVNT
jgi:hypothetical protein